MRALTLISCCSVIALLTFSTFAFDVNPPVIKPIARTDENSLIAHRQLVEKAKKGGIDVYFEGDSITRRWGTSEPGYRENYLNWRKNFFGWNAANFGWGADNIQNILWRLTNGELDGVNPKVIVLMAGANNLGRMPTPGEEDAKIQEVTSGIRAILDVCARRLWMQLLF